jgi:osmotically-inducible protein OsmY
MRLFFGSLVVPYNDRNLLMSTNDNMNTDAVDAELQAAIEKALLDHPKLDAAQITVHVQQRKAALRGKVDTEEEKNLAGNLASSVAGIEAVDNALHTSIGIAHALTSLASKISEEGSKD